ncbi:MAG: glucokinase [Algoriphagus sp.]|jgi:glucokinase
MHIIGIDLGGTNIKGLIINEAGEVMLQHQISTNEKEGTDWKKNVKDMADFLGDSFKGEIVAAGLSAPGLPNKENTCIEFLPNRLNGLENFHWGDYLGFNTSVLNDAQAATMAEKNFGAAKGIKNFILLTLGTGIGGGIVINNELYQGAAQMAGHMGHFTINVATDVKSIVGTPGSLEYAVGNYSVMERSNGAYASTRELVKAYEAGEPFASWVWLNSVRTLALAIASLSNVISPEAVVLAGGITLAKDSLFKPLQAFMNQYEYKPPTKTLKIIQAKFSDMAGAMGAASFALEKSKK